MSRTTTGTEVTQTRAAAATAASVANEAANDWALPSDAPAEPGRPTEPDETDEVPAPARRVRDAGMATAEYAIATLAAAGFAGLLLVVLRSDEVRGMLSSIVRQALSL